jgi:hypothetical protein
LFHQQKEHQLLQRSKVSTHSLTINKFSSAANAEVKISRLAKGIRKIGGIKHPKLKNVTRGWKLKKKQVKFSRNFKGKVIDGVHELYTLTAGMMLGMRCAVSSLFFPLCLSFSL